MMVIPAHERPLSFPPSQDVQAGSKKIQINLCGRPRPTNFGQRTQSTASLLYGQARRNYPHRPENILFLCSRRFSSQSCPYNSTHSVALLLPLTSTFLHSPGPVGAGFFLFIFWFGASTARRLSIARGPLFRGRQPYDRWIVRFDSAQ